MGRWSLVVVSLGVFACSSKPPAELTRGASVQVSDGFRNRGGVAISDEHVITDIELVKQADTIKVTGPDGNTLDANVLRRDQDLGVAVLVAKNAGLTAAPIADSAALKPGSPLNAFLYDAKGVGAFKPAKVTGWRFHNSRAYIETDLPFHEDIEGAGVFDAQGAVVGVMSFSLSPQLNYVLPIEYLTMRGTVAGTLVGQDPSEAFDGLRAEAKKHPKPLERPLDETSMANSYSYSRSALVGKIVMLDQKKTPAHDEPVAFEVQGIDATRKTRVIAKGKLTAPLIQWAPYPPDVVEAKREELRREFGDAYVAEHFSPYEYGELRWRLTLPLFCKEVTAEEVHNIILTLADQRTTGPFGFSDLINVCAAKEDGDGTAWEREWNMNDEPLPGPKEKGEPSSKKKKSKKKKSKKKR